MLTKKELKALMPKGTQKEIAERAGVSQGAVCKFFSDKTKMSEKIEKAALEIVFERQKTVSVLSNKIKALVNA